MSIDVSVVAVSWNTASVMERALRSVAATAQCSIELIVVDNGSTDGSVEALRGIVDLPIDVVPLGENLGFSRGVNVGLGRARGRYVLLCNPDIVLEPGGLDRLVEILDRRQEAWAVTPWFLNADGTPQWFWRRLPGVPRFAPTYLRWGKWLDRAVGRPVYRWRRYMDLEGVPSGEIEIEAVGAACLLARAEDLRAAGGLDEGYFNFFSDAHLMRDRREAGRLLMGTGAVRVCHDRGWTFRAVERWRQESEFLAALLRFVDGEPPWRRWPMRAMTALDLVLPHPNRRERRAAVTRPRRPMPMT